MKTYLFKWSSPGNCQTDQRLVLDADNISQAQDKFWTYLKTQAVFRHLWKLQFEAMEIEKYE